MMAVTQTISHKILIGMDLRYYSGICLAGLWMTTDCNSNCIVSNDEINWKGCDINWKGCGKHEA
jgi:hypothetical protein